MNQQSNRAASLTGIHAFGVTCLIAITLGWLLLVHQPGKQRVIEQREEAARLETLIDSRATQAQSVVMMSTKISELSKSIHFAATQIETQPDMSSLLNQLAELGKQCQTELIDVQPQPHRDHSDYSIQPVRCVLRADWSGLCHFIDGLSQLKLPVRVGSLQTNTDPNGQLGATQLELQLIFSPKGGKLYKALHDSIPNEVL